MTTARAIVTEAFGEIGVLDPGSPLSASDVDFARVKLNTLLDAWAADTSLAFTATTTVFNKPAGTQFAIGPGQTIDVARPLRIEDSSFVRVGNVDYPLRVVDEAEYNAIGIKSIGSWPTCVYFDGGSPVGNVFFWPSGAAEIHLVTYRQLGAFADLDTDYGVPPGYKNAIVLSLAESLLVPYRIPPDVRLLRAAANARRAISSVRVPQLDICRIRGRGLLFGGMGGPAALFAGSDDMSTGVDGAPGSVWRSGSGAPSNALGIDGDFYLDQSNGDVYQRVIGVYAFVVNVVGPPGAPGSTWRTGVGAPSNGIGINGDFYLNATTGDVYTRTAGVYSIVANIKAASGPITNTVYTAGQIVSYTMLGVVHTISYSTINGTSVPVSDVGGTVTRTFHWKNTTPPLFDYES